LAHAVNFSEGKIDRCKHGGTDFAYSIFRNTNLENATFLSKKKYTISPFVNNIQNAKFDLPEAMTLLYSMEIEIVNTPNDD